MTIEARLRHDRENKDGTRTLRIYVNHHGKYKFYTTDIRLKKEQWSESKQIVKGLPKIVAQKFNAQIETLKQHYKEKLEKGIPADRLNSGVVGAQENHFLLDFLSLFIKEAQSGLHKVSTSTLRNYNSAFTRISEYCRMKGLPDLALDKVDMNWYRDYYLWIQENKYGVHGFDNHIKIVKRIMRESHKRQLHNNMIWQNPDFKGMKKGFSDKIYLTPEEIKRLEAINLEAIPHLERERDRFLISYYFIMRWEDSTLINQYNVVDQGGLNYVYTSKKTKIKCIIPITKKAYRLLDKYNYKFNHDSNQKCNEKIKEIAAMAGINEIITQGPHTAAKYKFITTHTARRSAATNLYLQGMDVETIARLGGWTELSTLKLYLRASGLDVVQVAKRFDFFKD